MTPDEVMMTVLELRETQKRQSLGVIKNVGNSITRYAGSPTAAR